MDEVCVRVLRAPGDVVKAVRPPLFCHLLMSSDLRCRPMGALLAAESKAH